MDLTPPRVLIVGGNSSIARHLLALFPEAGAIARTEGGPRVRAIGDYRHIRPRDMAGAQVVINCAGIVSGTEAALRGVNVDLQALLASIARDASVERYIAIGSFSIFGPRTRIDRDTPVAPVDAYGRSKRDGEQALVRLQTDRFGVLSVAFPAIIGTTRPGKVERMLRLWQRIGVWPVPAHDVVRSMIGATGAAHVLAGAVADDRTGRVLAADPVAFGYRVAAGWLRTDIGGAFLRVPVPDVGAALLERVAPGLHRSMMADSLLDSASNYARELGVESSLRRELAAAVARRDDR